MVSPGEFAGKVFAAETRFHCEGFKVYGLAEKVILDTFVERKDRIGRACRMGGALPEKFKDELVDEHGFMVAIMKRMPVVFSQEFLK